MSRKYPSLTYDQVLDILRAWGFTKVHQVGSHEKWVGLIRGLRQAVTVDENASPFQPFILKSMISQSGLSYAEFYGADKVTARKANVKYRRPRV